MTYEELERLVANPLTDRGIALNTALQDLVGRFITEGEEGISIDRRHDLSSAECLNILHGIFIKPSYIHSHIKELVTDPKSEEEIAFHLSANGEECKITFDHERRDYTMRWDMEGGKFISTSETLSQLMQLALEKFIKSRETAEGFIPGAFIA